MKHKLEQYRWTCDFCQVKVDNFGDRPDGWINHWTHDHGMTGYSKQNDICGECAKKVTKPG